MEPKHSVDCWLLVEQYIQTHTGCSFLLRFVILFSHTDLSCVSLGILFGPSIFSLLIGECGHQSIERGFENLANIFHILKTTSFHLLKINFPFLQKKISTSSSTSPKTIMQVKAHYVKLTFCMWRKQKQTPSKKETIIHSLSANEVYAKFAKWILTWNNYFIHLNSFSVVSDKLENLSTICRLECKQTTIHM